MTQQKNTPWNIQKSADLYGIERWGNDYFGNDNILVVDILGEFYDIKKLEHIEHIYLIKNLLSSLEVLI